jgi:hypothetical protein
MRLDSSSAKDYILRKFLEGAEEYTSIAGSEWDGSSIRVDDDKDDDVEETPKPRAGSRRRPVVQRSTPNDQQRDLLPNQLDTSYPSVKQQKQTGKSVPSIPLSAAPPDKPPESGIEDIRGSSDNELALQTNMGAGMSKVLSLPELWRNVVSRNDWTQQFPQICNTPVFRDMKGWSYSLNGDLIYGVSGSLNQFCVQAVIQRSTPQIIKPSIPRFDFIKIVDFVISRSWQISVLLYGEGKKTATWYIQTYSCKDPLDPQLVSSQELPSFTGFLADNLMDNYWLSLEGCRLGFTSTRRPDGSAELYIWDMTKDQMIVKLRLHEKERVLCNQLTENGSILGAVTTERAIHLLIHNTASPSDYSWPLPLHLRNRRLLCTIGHRFSNNMNKISVYVDEAPGSQTDSRTSIFVYNLNDDGTMSLEAVVDALRLAGPQFSYWSFSPCYTLMVIRSANGVVSFSRRNAFLVDVKGGTVITKFNINNDSQGGFHSVWFRSGGRRVFGIQGQKLVMWEV